MARGGCAKFLDFGDLSFWLFVEFLGCTLVRDCGLAILGFFYGLKEEFC